MLSNRSCPPSTVIPELPYADVGAAAKWLCEVFGFTLRILIANHRAQLNVGDGAIVVTEKGDGPSRSTVMVRIEDVDAHHERTRKLGASILRPPATFPFGERQYTVEDLGGHHWRFTQSVADVDPVEWGGQPGELSPVR
jgi:uncharacterized glyoxalase superfamily protein PhnB